MSSVRKGSVSEPFGEGLDRAAILAWLREDDPARLEALWAAADETRRRHVGDEVHLRGLIEICNHCVRACGYCGLRAANREIERYRMSADEILACAHNAEAWGYGTVVLQSGEDYGLKTGWIADVVRRIKAETGLAVTLSLGERPEEDLAAWREAGADRYLLRFETSDDELYRLIHPDLPGRSSDRMADPADAAATRATKSAAASWSASPARPARAWPTTSTSSAARPRHDRHRSVHRPSGDAARRPQLGAGDPAGRAGPERRAHLYKVVALTRLVCPEANIPSTTALATINKLDGRETGAAARRQHRDAQPHAARVPRELRDLPGQGLRQRDGRDVPRLPAGPRRIHRPRRRQRAGRPQASRDRVTSCGRSDRGRPDGTRAGGLPGPPALAESVRQMLEVASAGSGSAKSTVERYRSPVSHMTVTISLPLFSGLLPTRYAA